ncbi:hypothetical protein Tco_1548695 [Tanacetum coccineum]
MLDAFTRSDSGCANVDDTRHTKECIKLEYEWKPPLCIDCHVFGHSSEHCPKRIVETVQAIKDVYADGFTTITSRKKKGKAKEHGHAQPQKKTWSVKLTKHKNIAFQPKVNSESHKDKGELSKVNLRNPFDVLAFPDEKETGLEHETVSDHGINDEKLDNTEPDSTNANSDSEVEEMYVESIKLIQKEASTSLSNGLNV